MSVDTTQSARHIAHARLPAGARGLATQDRETQRSHDVTNQMFHSSF